VSFGPVWGMCMPSWGPAAASASVLLQMEGVDGAPKTKVKAAASPTEATAAAPKAAAPATVEPIADPCPTKPYGQCAGLNFSATKEEKDLYNYSTAASTLACCPAGTSCVSFGPVWGMCMPSWVPAGPTSVLLAEATEETAIPKVKTVAPKVAAAPKPAEAAAPKLAAIKSEVDTCSTKPFGQCAGLNFTVPKADKSLYNYSKASTPPTLACCPAGTSCVTYGPVWGMCMPSWLPAP